MKKKLLFLLIGLVTGLAPAALSQKTTLRSGSLAPLKNVTVIGVEYKYDNMMVGKYKEAEFVSMTVAEYNKKEPGKGDQWQKDWANDRTGRFQPRFQEAFNSYCALKGTELRVEPNASGKYRMVFHTRFTEPGLNVYVTSRNASISAEVLVYDESGIEIARVTITDSPGKGIYQLDYNTGNRIQDAYANAGRTLAGMILREAFGVE